MQEISKERFDALAGYIRMPQMVLLTQEAAWFEIGQERLLGLIVWDRTDYDYGWIVLGRDRVGRFRAITQNVSLPTFDAARDDLRTAMERHVQLPDEEFFQGDEFGEAVDFFGPRVQPQGLHPSFTTLTSHQRFSPARGMIEAMMPFYQDVDGNFIQQFQTTGFDARLWELYLYATAIEIGYAPTPGVVVPDLLLEGPLGRLAIEATTANPPQEGAAPTPKNNEELKAYLDGYVPIKLARALTRKLYHPQRYWNAPKVDDAPFVIALQDFHAPGAMVGLVPTATEYVFGVRHSMVDGERKVERIDEHVFGAMRAPSGFFTLPEAENVSAVFLNPQGTLTKFNRLGYVAGFGNRNVRMIRSGIARGELNLDDPSPREFTHDVSAPDYSESWIEGTVVLHNPNARVPLDPNQVPGACHEFLMPDGTINSLLPEFQPYMSRTSISLDGDTGVFADEGND